MSKRSTLKLTRLGPSVSNSIKILIRKFRLLKKNVELKKIWVRKNFWLKKKFVLRIIFWSNKFNGKEPLLVSNKICFKKIYCKNILGYEKMFGAKKLFGAKNFFI